MLPLDGFYRASSSEIGWVTPLLTLAHYSAVLCVRVAYGYWKDGVAAVRACMNTAT